MLRAYSHAASPPSCRNAAMRLPQPRLGQCNSATSRSSRRIVPIATANEARGLWLRVFFFFFGIIVVIVYEKKERISRIKLVRVALVGARGGITWQVSKRGDRAGLRRLMHSHMCRVNYAGRCWKTGNCIANKLPSSCCIFILFSSNLTYQQALFFSSSVYSNSASEFWHPLEFIHGNSLVCSSSITASCQAWVKEVLCFLYLTSVHIVFSFLAMPVASNGSVGPSF